MPDRVSEQIPILSFFSGAGFLDIGFLRQKSFNIVWHNECNNDFARAYEHGVGQLGYNTCNNNIQNRSRIENIKSEQVVKQAFTGKGTPKMFGVIGGPPCPDFSRAGKNNGHKGENGKLTGKFVRMIIRLNPTFFLLENVPGLLETKKHRTYLFSLLKKLHEYYAVDINVLNALEYGVPQNRRRVFIVGINLKWLSQHRRNKHADIKSKSKKIITIDLPYKKSSVKVKQEIENLHWFPWPAPLFPDAHAHYGINKKLVKCPEDLTVDNCFSKINGHPNADDVFRVYSEKIKKNLIKEGDVSRKSFKRLHRFSYSPNAAYGNNEVHLHPTKHRRISVAEALALQSVPSEYAFPECMTLTAKFKAVGNGVPVALAEHVAKSILYFFQKEENNGSF